MPRNAAEFIGALHTSAGHHRGARSTKAVTVMPLPHTPEYHGFAWPTPEAAVTPPATTDYSRISKAKVVRLVIPEAFGRVHLVFEFGCFCLHFYYSA